MSARTTFMMIARGEKTKLLSKEAAACGTRLERLVERLIEQLPEAGKLPEVKEMQDIACALTVYAEEFG